MLANYPQIPKCFDCGKPLYKAKFDDEKMFFGTPNYQLIPIKHICYKKIKKNIIKLLNNE